MAFIFDNLNLKISLSLAYTIFFIIFHCIYFVKTVKPYLDSVKDFDKDENLVGVISLYLKKVYLSIAIAIVSSFLMPLFLKDSVVTTVEILKSASFGFGMSLMLLSSYLDLKFGDLYLFQMEMTTTISIIVIPIILSIISRNFIMMRYLLLLSIPYIILKLFNYLKNSEESIGGADVEFIIALITSNIAIFLAIGRIENNPIFIQTYYFEKLLTSIFINFGIAILFYFISKIISTKSKKDESLNIPIKENKRTTILNDTSAIKALDEKVYNTNIDFKFLPALIMVYSLTLFFLVFYI